MAEWLKGDTAPRDGTRVLLSWNGGVAVGRFTPGIDYGNGGWVTDAGSILARHEAMHQLWWQPMPEPPR